MTPKPRQKQAPKTFEVHRTLPSQYQTAGSAKRAPKPHQDVALPPSNKTGKVKRFGWKRVLLILFILIITPLLIIGIWDYRNFSKASNKIFGSSNGLGVLLPSQLDKSTNGRTNILMVGYSIDDPNHGGAQLTDSIMVVSIDKEDKTGYTLSIPRDLYVDIPDYGPAKINEAFQAGEQQSYNKPGNFDEGMGLLQEVITENFGVELHYYVLVNYTAVKDTVNALGGITVNLESPDPRGVYDPNFRPEEGGPLKLTNGPQQLDGQLALNLTRARGATFGSYGFPQSDFNRIENQQKVFAAIKSELSLKLILDPRENEKVFDAVASNLKTSLKISEVIPIYRLMQSVPEGSLKPVNLRETNGRNLLGSYTTSTGQSALIPAAGVDDFSEIRALIKELDT